MKKSLKIVSFVFVFALMLSNTAYALGNSVVGETEVTDSYILGDISGDGRVSILDSAYIFFNKIGLKDFNDEELQAADVDGDGEVTFDDMREITQFSLKMIDNFSVDTKPWVFAYSENSNVFNAGSSAGGIHNIEKDENGNNIYLYNEAYKKSGISEGSPIRMKGTNIECNGDLQIMEIDSCVIESEQRVYTEANILQMGSLKPIANLLKIKIVSENGNTTLVIPSMNAYVTDLGNDFDLDEIFELKAEYNLGETYEYCEDYYSHSLYVVRNGEKYIVEIYKEFYYTIQEYFTEDGKLVRTETIRSNNPDVYSITLWDYIGTEYDESMFDVPGYYIEISIEDLKRFISKNQDYAVLNRIIK